jgi:hypothetical protein
MFCISHNIDIKLFLQGFKIASLSRVRSGFPRNDVKKDMFSYYAF